MWTPTYYVRLVSLPSAIDGVTVPNDDGSFDIYLNADLCPAKQEDRLQHEINHIIEDHFYQEAKCVAQLEQEANAPLAPPAPADPPKPPRLPNVFEEAPANTLPFFASLTAFRDYMYSMRDQVQADKRRSAG